MTEIHPLTDVGPKSTKSKYLQGHAPSEGSKKESYLTSS